MWISVKRRTSNFYSMYSYSGIRSIESTLRVEFPSISPDVKESRIWDPANVRLWNPESIIWNPESIIWNPERTDFDGIQELLLWNSVNPESTNQDPGSRIQDPLFEIRNPRSGIRNRRVTWIPLHMATLSACSIKPSFRSILEWTTLGS